MKKVLVLIVCCLCSHLSFAEISQKVAAKATDFKKALYCAKDEEEINQIFKKYESTFDELLSDEERCFQKSVLLLERANFLQTEDNKKEFYYEFLKQRDTNVELIEAQNCTADFYAISADIISRLVNFSSGGELLRLSAKAKEYYLKAKKLDKKNFNASLGYGLWLYFAPSIAGGGFDSSIKEFSKSINNAKTDFDKYIALIYRSQVYFKITRVKNYEEDLKNAKDVLPDESLITHIVEKNKNGKLFFE